MDKKLILITNDDGIDAPGIKQLAEASLKYGDVYVVAPDGQRSAMSHSITCKEPVKVWEYDMQIDGVTACACSGTPADCVNIGVKQLLPKTPDYVFSGINKGYNISSDVQYSATLGAAFEGRHLGIHSIAFSRGAGDCKEVCDRYLLEMMEYCMQNPQGRNQVWSINFPECPLAECKGIKTGTVVFTDGFYDDSYSKESEEAGVKGYRISSKRIWDAPEGTDLRAIIDNYVSVGFVNNVS